MAAPIIRTSRFLRSPFMPAYLPDDAVVGVYNRRLYPWSIGDDLNTAYWQLRRMAMLYDVPETPIEIAGPEACVLLNYLFTRDVDNLRIGRASYAIACNAQGGVIMDGVLLQLREDCFWYVQADGEFAP